MTFMNVQKMRTATLRRFMARPSFDDELALHRVECLGSNGFTDNYEFLLAKQEEFASEPLLPPRLITGADLIQQGWHAGKALGRLLTTLQTLQLEGTLKTKEEALAWVAQHAPVPDVFEAVDE
jgi:poly(A) polymerase